MDISESSAFSMLLQEVEYIVDEELLEAIEDCKKFPRRRSETVGAGGLRYAIVARAGLVDQDEGGEI